ncbi:hypothetical protein IW262DRAFT_1448938 [Armillaria fumosa]|nr:hypothetical protein IW262DRAFT_1448938 [Armillaria fumosa]
MSEPGLLVSANGSGRARGRGKSRGGLGKYLRARGRGHGYEGEAPAAEDDEEKAERKCKFLRRQLGTNTDRYAEPEPELDSDDDDDDVDHSLAHISSRSEKVEQIAWDDELDKLSREKAIADANRDLKSRFRAKSERLRRKPLAPTARERKHEASYVNPKVDMEDFLDDLLG